MNNIDNNVDIEPKPNRRKIASPSRMHVGQRINIAFLQEVFIVPT